MDGRRARNKRQSSDAAEPLVRLELDVGPRVVRAVDLGGDAEPVRAELARKDADVLLVRVHGPRHVVDGAQRLELVAKVAPEPLLVRRPRVALAPRRGLADAQQDAAVREARAAHLPVVPRGVGCPAELVQVVSVRHEPRARRRRRELRRRRDERALAQRQVRALRHEVAEPGRERTRKRRRSVAPQAPRVEVLEALAVPTEMPDLRRLGVGRRRPRGRPLHRAVHREPLRRRHAHQRRHDTHATTGRLVGAGAAATGGISAGCSHEPASYKS